ncbi:MAG: energy transducer TonB [Terriglobales bacterium]
MPTSTGFQLGLLPERKLNKPALAASYGFLILLLIVMVNIGWIWPDSLNITRQYHVTELIPIPSLQPTAIKPKPQPILKAKLLPRAILEAPKLTVPAEIRVPRPQQPDVAAPKIEVNHFTPAIVKQVTGGARPTLIVTGEFGSSATPTVNAPIQKVQTGGFGDPDGLKGEGKPNAHLVAASTGSFDLPPGAGMGNGAGGAKGIQGTVASAGFGNGIAQAGQGDGRGNGRGGAVQTAGFSTAQFSQGSSRPHQGEDVPATSPVEIISKPNPVYTDEARQLRLQGEVLLEVLFAANGQLHVNRVVRGMGHGLDEAAIAAANKMRFKPAQHYSQPVDSTAIVHVVFQLAY